MSHPEAWIETRPFGGYEEWKRQCAVPCADAVVVDGMEFRVTARGMTPTAAFRIQGGGDALVKVNGGSESSRSIGRVAFGVGVPVALLGMAGFGYGAFEDEPGLKVAGGITLGVGAVLSLVALPLLVGGSTSVRNEKGDLIAEAASGSFRF